MAIESSINSLTSIGFGVGSVNIEPSQCNLNPSVVESGSDCVKAKSGIFDGDNLRQTDGASRATNEQRAAGEHLDNDSVDRPPNGIAELNETDTIDEKMNNTDSGILTEKNYGDCQKESTHNHTLDGSSVSGFKRARMTCEDQQPLVHVRYEFLSRVSKRKLDELLSNWSKWHAQHCSSSKDSNEALESGNETYFPSLHFGNEKSTVSFVMDDQVRKNQRVEISLNGDSVPLYDREYAFALTSADGSTNKDRGLETLNASHCFNCGSYSNSLKECLKLRDNVAVSNAWKQHQSKRNHTAGPLVPTEYYQNTPLGKYDGLKPGALDTETRELLGLGERDPPPWLNRMRELGYPPGYIDVEDEDQPSGITIYADDETKEQNEEIVKVDILEPRRKMSVAFPGVNAPVPENGDQSCWSASQMPPNFNSSSNQSNHRSNYSPELISIGHSISQRWRSDSTDGFFTGYAQELDSFMSGYSHSCRDLGPDYDSRPGSMDGLFAGDNHEFDSFMSGHSRSYRDLGLGYNSESGARDGFFAGYRREFDFTSVYSPRYRDFGPNYNSESHNPCSFSPYSFANSWLP